MTFIHKSRSWVSLRTGALVIPVYQSAGTSGEFVAVVVAFIRSYIVYFPHLFIRILKRTEKDLFIPVTWYFYSALIRLMRDYVTCYKFTTKPRLCGICSNFRCPHVVFTWVFFLCWLFWELAQEKNLHFALSKRGLVVILAGLMSSHIRAIVFTFCKFSLDFCLIIRWYRKWSSLSFSKKNRRESV